MWPPLESADDSAWTDLSSNSTFEGEKLKAVFEHQQTDFNANSEQMRLERS